MLHIFFWFCRAIKKDADVPDRKRAKKVAKVGDGAQKLDKIIAKQNKEFTKIRNELKAHTNQGDWVYILQRNSQAVPTKKSEVSFFSFQFDRLVLAKDYVVFIGNWDTGSRSSKRIALFLVE